MPGVFSFPRGEAGLDGHKKQTIEKNMTQETDNMNTGTAPCEAALTPPQDLSKLSFGSALDALRQAQQATIATATDSPYQLPLSKLTELPRVFQIRNAEADERHVNELLRALTIHRALDPITVWPCGGKVFVVDGHHRLEAYRRSRKPHIPVSYFQGTVDEAIQFAETANGKLSLNITHEERANYAWKLVTHAEKLGNLSRPQLIQRTGVSKGTIDSMRKALSVLGARAVILPTWREAMKEWKRNDDDDRDYGEDWQRAEAMKIVDRMGKEFGKTLAKRPEIAAIAFSHLLGRKAADVAVMMLEEQGLVVALRDEDGNEVEDLETFERPVRETPDTEFECPF